MVTEAPYNAILTFTTKAGTTKTFSGFSGGAQEFNLLESRLSSTGDGMSGRCTFLIEDSAASLYSFFDPTVGSISFTLQKGKTAGGVTAVLKGFVEVRKVKRPFNGQMFYELTGYDKNVLLNWRVVNFDRYQKRTPGGTLDTTDTSMDIGNLAKFTMGYDTDGSTANLGAYYPMYLLSSTKTLANEHSITAGGVSASGTILPDYSARYRRASDVLKDLSDHKDWIYYIDENNILQFKAATATDSGILVTDSASPTWDTTKVCHIIDDSPLEIEQSLEDTKNMLIGVGGNIDSPATYQQTTASASTSLYNTYLAYKLTGAQKIVDAKINSIAVWADKVGSPDSDLLGEIRQDSGGSPTGALVKGFSIPRANVGTAATWVIADCVADINTQVDHWLILYKDNSGTGSTTKTFRWYHNNGSGGTVRTSTDGITWSDPGNPGNARQYTFLVFPDSQVVSMAPDNTSITNYYQRDDVITDTSIRSVTQMRERLQGMLKFTKNPKEIIMATCYPPDTIPKVGQLVTVQDSLTGINGQHKVVKTEYLLKDTGAFAFELTVSKVWAS